MEMVRDQIEKRLSELKIEFEEGQKTLYDLDSRRENLRQTLLRISGAVQILEELLKEEDVAEQPPEES
jgi:hypothetical protein